MAIEPTAVSRPRPPDLIAGYRLERLVGQGGMGEVHRAVQLSLDRTVAVKLLASDLATDENFVARFDKEGAALATLSHPNIVSIVDKGHHNSTYYLVMEYIDGPSLREVMRLPDLTQGTGLKIIFEVCRAIDYAHNRGVIHRDLKPENILFDDQAGGLAKVTDFGLAGFADEANQSSRFRVTQTHVAMGTLSYMAPEQRVDAKTADHRADIYSLGVILYELLVGEVPLGTFDPPSSKKPGLDARLDAIVTRCLKPDPADRYQRTSELLSDLEPMVPLSMSMPPRTLSRLERIKTTARRAARKTIRMAAFAVVLAALAIIASTFIRSKNAPVRQSPGLELSAELGNKWTVPARARLERGPESQSLSFEDGPDTLMVVAVGRKPVVQEGALLFRLAGAEAAGGRAVLDADFDGDGLRLRADVSIDPPPSGLLADLKRAALGARAPGRAGLLLVGDTGRYVALVVGEEGVPVLEWALGAERRGSMSSMTPLKPSKTRLELTIDREGRVTASTGVGRDERVVGDSLNLGPEWKEVFGRMPKAALGCLDSGCQFQNIRVIASLKPAPVALPLPPLPIVAAVPEKKPSVSVQKATASPKGSLNRIHKRTVAKKR